VPRSRSSPRLKPSVGWLLRSLTCWRGPGQSRPGTTAACHTRRVPWSIAATPARLRPHGRRDPRPSSCCHPCRPMVPCTLAGAVGAPSCMRGRRGGPRLRQQRGGCRVLACVGTTAPAGKQHGVPGTRSTGAAGVGALCPVPAHGGVSCPAEGRAAGSGGGGRHSRQCWAPAASGTEQGGLVLLGGCAGHGGTRTLHPCAWCCISRHHPRPTRWCGIRWPGWGPRGGRRSVTGKAGHPRQFPATQQGLAGDARQRPLVPRSRCRARLKPGVRPKAKQLCLRAKTSTMAVCTSSHASA